MSRVIDVNWDELNNSSNSFDTQAIEMLDIKSELLKSIEMIDNG